jgi:16S rRNA (cytosine1402-N4)-methyltransferase
MSHIPVLLEETVSVLGLKEDSVVFDCTLGAGGHGAKILEILGANGAYVGIDADPTALASVKLNGKARIHLINDNFANVVDIAHGLKLKPTAILADLGWRSEQFEAGDRGFSFQKDEPLLMTFGDPSTHVFTAHDVVNDWKEESLSDIIYGYGEERFARRIAKAIVRAREEAPIETSKQLADIVSRAYPAVARRGRIHPATKTFQAIRITVNDEIGTLKKLLDDGFELLENGGRIAIISFHSLEDRIVKRFFDEKTRNQLALKLIKKPIVAGDTEREENPRSRSAKLRVIEKTINN